MNTSIRSAAPIATLFDSDAQRWDAVRQRDPRADGAFFYSAHHRRVLPSVVRVAPGAARKRRVPRDVRGRRACRL